MNLLANVDYSYLFTTLPGFFHSFHPHDFFDVLMVAAFIYVILIFIRQTHSFFIFNTLLLLFLVTYLSSTFDLALSRQLFEPLVAFFAVIFVVVFQREIRRFFKWFNISRGRLNRRKNISLSASITDSIVEAASILAKNYIGALIILSGEYPLDDVVEGGFPLNGQVSTALLLSIFDNHTPGHDGAVLVEDKKLKTFGLHLPLSEEFRGFHTMGTRHRAAVGLSERTDALAVVVSEEKGTISVAQFGALRSIPDRESLDKTIRDFMKENIPENHDFWHYIIVKNFFIKILSIIIALALWILLVFQGNISSRDVSVPIEFSHIPPSVLVEKVIPSEITVTISGNTRDVANLTEKDIKIVIDLENAGEGTEQIDINKEEVSLPPYFDLTNIKPSRILIGLQKIGS